MKFHIWGIYWSMVPDSSFLKVYKNTDTLYVILRTFIYMVCIMEAIICML